MHRPFDYMPDGETKIDVNNHDHVSVVLQRNNELKNAIENGIDLDDFIYKAHDFDVKCLKCGNSLNNHKEVDRLYSEGIVNHVKKIECKTCKSYYKQDKNKIFMIVPKPKKTTKQ